MTAYPIMMIIKITMMGLMLPIRRMRRRRPRPRYPRPAGVDDISGKGIKALAIPGNSEVRLAWQRDAGEFIKFTGTRVKHPLPKPDAGALIAASDGPSGLVFDSDLEHGHHQPDDIQRPRPDKKKKNNSNT